MHICVSLLQPRRCSAAPSSEGAERAKINFSCIPGSPCQGSCHRRRLRGSLCIFARHSLSLADARQFPRQREPRERKSVGCLYAANTLMKAGQAVDRLDKILNEKALVEPQHPKKPQDATVSFENVTFTYAGATEPALNNMSFSVQRGKTLALVGPSGGGKTTAASLIPRFFDADNGSVKIGGVDVREIASEDLMRQVAFVFQDSRLFKDSILENIRAAKPGATREEVLAAVHAARCDDILEKLPNGLDTVIGADGVYVSGGEQQRIALARAILKDAPIVVLDEATAFADAENEAAIQKAFSALIKSKTVIMIAHRLTTIKNADEILVIDEGKVKERGNHDTLLKADGLYSQMWKDYHASIVWKVRKEAVK